MASGMKWNGAKFKQELERATWEGLTRAGQFYHTRCQILVKQPNTGRSIPVKRRTPGGNKRTRTIYPNPSKPGEAPRLRTGFGRKSIVVNFLKASKSVRVGVTANGIYMFYLEVGTRHIARRPWLMRTLVDNREMIGRLAANRWQEMIEKAIHEIINDGTNADALALLALLSADRITTGANHNRDLPYASIGLESNVAAYHSNAGSMRSPSIRIQLWHENHAQGKAIQAAIAGLFENKSFNTSELRITNSRVEKRLRHSRARWHLAVYDRHSNHLRETIRI